MPNHVRRQIRDAAVAALTGLATTGARVYPSRVYPMQDANLPGLRVYMQEDAPSGEETLGVDRLAEFTAMLVVEICVKATTDLEDLLDQIALEVQIALYAPAAMGVAAKRMGPPTWSSELGGQAEKPVAVGTMTIEVGYVIALKAPDVAF